MKKLFLASAILATIAEKADKIGTQCELSTLNESEDLTTIEVSNVLETEDMFIFFNSTVDLTEGEDGKLVCSGIDQNTENTNVCILAKNGAELEFELEGEIYDAIELASHHDFHEAVLNSELSTLTMEKVDEKLRQILIEYAHSSV